jgi:ADP-ribose pyrophosphatase YjhB (NUDIX family)
MKVSNIAGGVVLNGGLVLVVNQHGNSWSLPKGHLESGEDSLSAARREIEEESGINQIELIKDLGSYERHKIALSGGDDKSELKKIRMFLFKTSQTELKPIDKDNPEARWVLKVNVAKLLTHPKDKDFFLSIIDEI